MFSSDEFNVQTASLAATALKTILARRTHIKVIFGEEHRVPGTLGKAVNLPGITRRLENRSSKQREQGLDEFRALWDTLSARTCRAVLEAIGWYDPHDLEWDDKRSNRQADVSDDSP